MNQFEEHMHNEIGFVREEIEESRKEAIQKDPDTIGTEAELYKKMSSLLDILEDIIDKTNGSSKDMMYLSSCLKDLSSGRPISFLESYEKRPNQWTVKSDTELVNKRYKPLKKTTLNGEEFYNCKGRFKFRDLLNENGYGSSTTTPYTHSIILDLEMHDNVCYILERKFPIEFPFSPTFDTYTVYYEFFESRADGDSEPMYTLALWHIIDNMSHDAKRLMWFFNVNKETHELSAIERRDYAARRQLFEKMAYIDKKEEEAKENNAE